MFPKRNVIYRTIRDAIESDDNTYYPSVEYADDYNRYNILTNVRLRREYGLYLDHMVDHDVRRFGQYLESKEEKFKLNPILEGKRMEDAMRQMFMNTAESKDKFVVRYRYMVGTTGQEAYQQRTITKGNELKIFELMLVDENYDQMIRDFKMILEVEIVRLNVPKRVKKGGAFFRYYNKHHDRIDLSDFQIYGNYNSTNYTTNCLIHAFKQFGLNETNINRLKLVLKIQKISRSRLKDIATHMGININIRMRFKNDTNWKNRTINVGGDKTIYLCLYEDHYFIDKLSKYTAYSIKHFNELKDKTNWFGYFKKDEIAKEGERRIHSWKLIDIMFKNNMFKQMDIQDLAKTQYHGEYKQKYPKALNSGDMKLEEYKPKYNTQTHAWKPDGYGSFERYWRPTRECDFQKKKKPVIKDRAVVYADFETDTHGDKHRPFMISYMTVLGSKIIDKTSLFGENCAVEFLNRVPDLSIVYFHNLGYDINFLFEHCRSQSFIRNGSFVYLYVADYQGKKLTFRDSYAMIPDKLAGFPKMFGMPNIKKEIMPYSLYRVENYDVKCHISEVEPHVNDDDWDEFLTLCVDYVDEKQMFDKVGYAKFYCERDVELLYKGMSIFRENMISEFKLDSLSYLTISSVANDYLMKQGCFDGVYKLGGARREFIQATVKGGRCMTRKNQKFEVKEVLNDFDGVSLYPSSMFLFDGFIKGKPKVIKQFEPENYTHYFVKIEITKVNKILDFPLISVKDDNGILQYENKKCVMYVDKYALEDLVEFQGIEYKFLEGYYFDEGFNTKIKDTIKHMFNQRLKYKAENNPIQTLYKLLMNSSYGKTIMKEHLTDDIIINADQYNDYVYRNHHCIKTITKTGEQYWIQRLKEVNNHMSFPQVGSSILSYSKRIMNRVFGVAHELDISIYYQDTDSMHIKDSDVKIIEQAYDDKYALSGLPRLIGKNLGQFHCDFDLPSAIDPVSVRSIFLGKKTYIDDLEGKDRKGKKVTGQHCRFKGIPNECIRVKANEDYGGDMFKLYSDMLRNNKKITFDLCKGINRTRPMFKNENGTVRSLPKFEREVQFS